MDYSAIVTFSIDLYRWVRKIYHFRQVEDITQIGFPRPPPPPDPILFPYTDNHWDTPQELLKVISIEATPSFPPLSVQDKSLRHER